MGGTASRRPRHPRAAVGAAAIPAALQLTDACSSTYRFDAHASEREGMDGIAGQPTYGYRRVHALIRRRRPAKPRGRGFRGGTGRARPVGRARSGRARPPDRRGGAASRPRGSAGRDSAESARKAVDALDGISSPCTFGATYRYDATRLATIPPAARGSSPGGHRQVSPGACGFQRTDLEVVYASSSTDAP